MLQLLGWTGYGIVKAVGLEHAGTATVHSWRYPGNMSLQHPERYACILASWSLHMLNHYPVRAACRCLAA